jgi:hypothetical protein
LNTFDSRLARLVLLGAVLLFAACAGSDDLDPTSGTPTSSGSGTLAVMLHDQAAPQLTAARITLGAAEAREVGGGEWFDVGVTLDEPMDLLQYVGPDNAITVATGLVPGSTYDALRLTVTAVEVELDGGTGPIDVPLPPEGVTFAVEIPPFTVEEGGTVTLVVEIPVDSSFQLTGTDVVFDPALLLTEVRTD